MQLIIKSNFIFSDKYTHTETDRQTCTHTDRQADTDTRHTHTLTCGGLKDITNSLVSPGLKQPQTGSIVNGD